MLHARDALKNEGRMPVACDQTPGAFTDRGLLGDLSIFLAVAEEGNFTRAGHRLGVSQSAVSHTIRRLEDKIGVRLLNRSSRNVTPTDAGDQLLASLRPSFQNVGNRIEEIRTLGERQSGLVRVTSSLPATRELLWPVVTQLVRDYPDVRIEISTEGRLSDLAEDQFDCAIGLGENLSPDMIAVPVGPPIEMAAVARVFRQEGRTPPSRRPGRA